MKSDNDSPIADALRKAGYVCLPRLWVKSADMPAIHRIAAKHKDAVNQIRSDARHQAPVSKDPIHDKDAAWAAYEKMRGG